jgi:putative membrane protein
MKKLSLLFTAVAVMGMVACGSSRTAQTTNELPVMASSSPSNVTATTTMSSPDMAGILFAANQGEIDQANAAMPKLANSDVRDFARMMISDHNTALTNVTNVMAASHIISHDASFDAIQLRNKAKQLVTNFNSAGGSVDRAYMVAMVEGHQQLLDMMDRSLIPSARGDVLTLLQSMRPTVAAHLDRARQILGTMQ